MEEIQISEAVVRYIGFRGGDLGSNPWSDYKWVALVA